MLAEEEVAVVEGEVGWAEEEFGGGGGWDGDLGDLESGLGGY